MRDAIANLQSLYQRHGRVFSDGPSMPSDVSRRTGGRDPQRQSPARRATPSCRASAFSRASEQDNSFAASSRHGGSRYAPRESVEHRVSPPMSVVRAGISTTNRLLELQAKAGRLRQRLHDLCDRTEQSRQDRLSLEAWVQRIHLYRSDDRSEFAFYQLKNERKRQACRDEVADIRCQHAALQNQIESLARVQKYLLDFLEHRGCIRPMKRSLDDGTGEEYQHKT
uniref:RxLR effector candidate protein n=1 Tax=Hyaloperonospora arabidopsidis (strain Emoy2) TaxID=559515 RepID=M4B314_HYAAE